MSILCLAIAGGVAWTAFGKAEGERAARSATLLEVTKGSIEETVTAQGKLEPKEFVDVGTQVSGQLKHILVDIGGTAKKGDLLAEIDPRIYTAKVEGDQANLNALEAQLGQQAAQRDLARQKNARNERLIAAKAISQEALEQSRAELRVAENSYKALQAQIKQAASTLTGSRTNLEYTKIYAPIDGTVVSQTARAGQTLNANQQAPIILQVANLDVMTVRVQVAEADVSRLQPGMKMYFTTLGMMDKRWKGTVRQILPTPETVNDVVLYIVLVDVDNRERQLLTGMSTQVFFEIGNARDVLTVPVAALGRHVSSKDSEQGKAYMVTVVGEDGPEKRLIHVGLQNRTEAEVRSGLKLGEKVEPMLAAQSGGPRKGGGQPRMRGPML
nr:efflux RND transporter periplasmic adaptor subunit [Govania unica]